MPPAHRSILRLLAVAGALTIGACGGEAAPPAACGPDALGVSRTLTIDADSPPVYDLLEPGEVILTFDDGPDFLRTRPVLEALSEECTRATFFLLGTAAKANPAIVRDITEAGHTVGSHSMDHANLAELSLQDAVQNARNARAAVEMATGQRVPLFRFPFLITTPELSAAIHDAGMIKVGVEADGADWTSNSPEEAAGMILTKLKEHGGRGVILLHDPFSRSAKRTRYLLQQLKENGYRVVALEAARD